MTNVLRHLLAVALLPFVVVVLVPTWVARRNGVSLAPGALAGHGLAASLGLVLVIAGVALFASSLGRFARDGEGTLAPWDPPRRLVVRGPYRHVRNPMISGVSIILFGEALLVASRPHLIWALMFLTINALYIPLFEEPQLRRRFGAAYDEYCRHVPRLIPRLRPWTPDADRA